MMYWVLRSRSIPFSGRRPRIDSARMQLIDGSIVGPASRRIGAIGVTRKGMWAVFVRRQHVGTYKRLWEAKAICEERCAAWEARRILQGDHWVNVS